MDFEKYWKKLTKEYDKVKYSLIVVNVLKHAKQWVSFKDLWIQWVASDLKECSPRISWSVSIIGGVTSPVNLNLKCPPGQENVTSTGIEACSWLSNRKFDIEKNSQPLSEGLPRCLVVIYGCGLVIHELVFDPAELVVSVRTVCRLVRRALESRPDKQTPFITIHLLHITWQVCVCVRVCVPICYACVLYLSVCEGGSFKACCTSVLVCGYQIVCVCVSDLSIKTSIYQAGQMPAIWTWRQYLLSACKVDERPSSACSEWQSYLFNMTQNISTINFLILLISIFTTSTLYV